MDLSNKRICVTGGAGFLGTHLIKKLNARGAHQIFIPKIEDYVRKNFYKIKKQCYNSNVAKILRKGIGGNYVNLHTSLINFYSKNS